MASIRDVLDAFAYYIGSGGYYEKASSAAKYLTRDRSNFQANRGSANYTYMGKLCGVNPGAWCAMMVSTAVYEGCGSSTAAAKSAMWGVWPYTACNQLWEAAPSAYRHWSYYQLHTKGKSGSDYTPAVGDVIVFSDNGTVRSHTGMVYAVDGSYVYTYEGNSGNMARTRSYSLKSSYIYGYVTLNLSGSGTASSGAAGSEIAKFQRWLGVSADGVYGSVTKAAAVRAHQKYLNSALGASIAVDGVWGSETYYATARVQKPDITDDVTVWQGLLRCAGHDPQGIDGSFGVNTEAATIAFQKAVGLNATGIADRYTWAKMFGCGRPAHTLLKKGSRGAEVRYLQKLLTQAGWPLETDGIFGELTDKAVRAFQQEKALEVDGEVGPLTWAAIE